MKQNNVKEKVFVIKLTNGIEMNKKHPTTFLIPDENFINNNLKIGSVVKIGDQDYNERFWVKVVEFLDDDLMICEILNDLYSNQPYDYLDKIIIRRENIIGFECLQKKGDIDEEINQVLERKTENKWRDWEYCELISKSNNINLN